VGKYYLQVSKLGELLAAVVELTGEWLDLLVYDLVCPDVSTLRKSLAAYVALVRAFPSVASFMGLTESLAGALVSKKSEHKP
jgi:hypothetical protein